MKSASPPPTIRLPPQLHHRPFVQQAIRIPNHQHPWLPIPMGKHQPQPRRISSHFEDRLTHHRTARPHPRRQLDTIHPRRLFPSPTLPIHQISPNQPFTLRLPAPVASPAPTPVPASRPIPNQKPRNLLHPRHRKAHLIEALRLPIATTLCRCTSETPITTDR